MFKIAGLVLLLAVSANAQTSLVAETKSGANTNFAVTWKTNPSPAYPMPTIKVGDTIELTWSGFHDAVVVPDSADPCATSDANYIKKLADPVGGGKASYTVTENKSFWIICTVPGHCASQNQKIMFMAEGATHSTPLPSTTTTTPASPPPATTPNPKQGYGSNAWTSLPGKTLFAAVFGAGVLLAVFH